MARSFSRSVPLTILISVFSVTLSIALLVGWTLVILQNAELSAQVTSNIALLVAGIVSFGIIMVALIWFSVILLREIREGRRQTTFIDSVTHELKSPLASLKLGLETLGRTGLDGEQVEKLRTMMLDDVDRLNVFIEDILVASRLSDLPFEPRRHYTVTELLLGELVAECASLVGKRHKSAPEAITWEVDSSLTLTTDATALATVINNLLDNALKYSGDQPVVHIRARETDRGRVQIEVTDQGIGIGRPHLKRVFQRFYRVPGEAVHRRRGTGLGLFVVARLVRNLGGRIEARSEGAGQGTTIQVSLPRRTRTLAPAEPGGSRELAS